MNSKTLINQRFIKAVNFLISEKIVENKSTIAEKINISKSKFSEILNQRMNIGLEDLAAFTEEFLINPLWVLTGKGNLSLEKDFGQVSEPKQEYKKENLNTDSLNFLQQQIADLKEDKEELKKDKRILQDIIDHKLGNQNAS